MLVATELFRIVFNDLLVKKSTNCNRVIVLTQLVKPKSSVASRMIRILTDSYGVSEWI